MLLVFVQLGHHPKHVPLVAHEQLEVKRHVVEPLFNVTRQKRARDLLSLVSPEQQRSAGMDRRRG